jgi:hypothetical protein
VLMRDCGQRSFSLVAQSWPKRPEARQ